MTARFVRAHEDPLPEIHLDRQCVSIHPFQTRTPVTIAATVFEQGRAESSPGRCRAWSTCSLSLLELQVLVGLPNLTRPGGGRTLARSGGARGSTPAAVLVMRLSEIEEEPSPRRLQCHQALAGTVSVDGDLDHQAAVIARPPTPQSRFMARTDTVSWKPRDAKRIVQLINAQSLGCASNCSTSMAHSSCRTARRQAVMPRTDRAVPAVLVSSPSACIR